MITRANDKIFDEIYEIMDKSFPVDEHRPYEEQRDLLEKDRYEIYVEYVNGMPIGFISIWEFEKFVYVEHFAVDESFRNGGFGREILMELLEMKKKEVVLEVEPPESSITQRRIEFYERNGFFLNGYAYIQPPISKGLKPLPLMIMSWPRALEEAEFKEIRDSIYEAVYGLGEKDYERYVTVAK